jgi:hypothetical protein
MRIGCRGECAWEGFPSRKPEHRFLQVAPIPLSRHPQAVEGESDANER